MISAKTIKKTALAPTVLITHGGGFLAGHLAETLLVKNCRVVVLSNLKEHADIKLHGLLKSPKFALFDCDINQELPASIESVDYIFHLGTYDTFVNAQETVSLESLLATGVGTKNLLDLAKRSQAKFALVSPLVSQIKSKDSSTLNADEAQKYSRTLVNEYRSHWGLDVRLVNLGQVYGPGIDPLQGGVLGDFLQSVITSKPMRVVGDGARKEFYLYVSDAVNGLVKSLFSQSDVLSFTLTEKKANSALELAYILKSLADGKTDLDFVDGAADFLEPTVDLPVYPPTWLPKVELKDGLAKTLRSLGYKPNIKSFKAGILIDQKIAEKAVGTVMTPREDLQTIGLVRREEPKIGSIKLLICRAEKTIRRVNKGKVKNSLAGLAGVALVLMVLLGVPLLQSYTHAKSALKDLESYQSSISKLDSQKSQKLSENAYNHLAKLERSLGRVSFMFKMVGKEHAYRSLLSFVESAKNFSFALHSLSLGVEPFSNLWDGIKPAGEIKFNAESFKESAQHFTDAKTSLEFAKAGLLRVDRGSLPESIRADFDTYSSALTTINENSDFMTQLALEFPKIIGLAGDKRYLILFQNSNELRPTGGFLGSYAVVELKNGRISKIDIDDIYNPDGQLKLSKANADVTAPEALKQALNEEVLYIRNANWNPSFPASSQVINNLFKLVDGRSFDGIIALDLYFTRDLLSVIGPVYLTAYDEEIRVDNMYERAQFHSDFDFKEGVSAKKAFMTLLGGKMLESVFSLPQDKIPALLGVLYSSLEQKHILVDLYGTHLSKYLGEKGWDGSLLDASAESDYLYVVNANVGGTKSNYYVKNDINYAVSSKTSDGVMRGELELTYENTQQNADWPGGPYKNYVRVLVQDGSKLTGAFVMGEQDAVATQTPSDVMGATSGTDIFDKVVITKVGKYISFEYPIVVNPQEKVSLLFNYDLPGSLSAKKDVNNYNLVWQKQPGTQNDSIRFMFASPFGTKISQPVPAGVVSDNIYEYKTVLNSDLHVRLFYK
jgi:nucleoside-diphosphate-sugar epimerase